MLARLVKSTGTEKEGKKEISRRLDVGFGAEIEEDMRRFMNSTDRAFIYVE